MGKRTNTILQSAFFTLANVMPAEDAVKYMKDAAEHSYLKKGRDVVEKNWNAIDAGATAFVKVDVPASWATAENNKAEAALEGRPETVKVVKDINPDALVICHGGPISEPKDAAYVIEHVPGIDGFFGATSIERLAAERGIKAQTEAFKAIKK